MKIVPIRDLKDTVKIENLCSQSKEPVFVTKNGYGRLVVMDIDFYDQLLNDMCIANALKESFDAYERGEYLDGEEFLKELQKRYGV